MSYPMHPKVVLKVSRKKVPALLQKSKAVYNAMSAASSTFTNCNPALPVLLGLVQAYDTAAQAATTRGKGLAAARDLKGDALASALESERCSVQILIDDNPEQAQTLAELAGMNVATVTTRAKALLAVTLGIVSGTVTLVASRKLLKQGRGKAPLTIINWRYTPDGGKTFIQVPSTPTVKTTITGLAANVLHGFQVCLTDSAGTTDWSPVVSVLVR